MNPFLGARPYGAADARLFFGRSRIASRLAERIDLQELTILCSPSGLGKTSLLRAAVLPRLEQFGLYAIYLRPDPPQGEQGLQEAGESLLGGRLRDAILGAALPDPAREREVLDELCASAPAGLTLGEAPGWFDDLAEGAAPRERLLRSPSGQSERLAMLARYLRGSVSLLALQQQAVCLGLPDIAAMLEPGIPVTDFAARLDGVGFRAALRQAMSRAGEALQSVDGQAQADPVALETLRLRAMMQRLFCDLPDRPRLVARTDGDERRDGQAVLVIDQFEQVFTLSRPATVARVLRQVAALVPAEIPMHVVLAVRKEWYADLVKQLQGLLPAEVRVQDCTVHLEPMNRREAFEVMRSAPARARMPAIPPAQCEAIWRILHDGDTIESVVLSIACAEYFDGGFASEAELDEQHIEGLLRRYLQRALDRIAESPEGLGAARRKEALDLLGEIVGTAMTRGFTTRTQLLQAPLRDPAMREQILQQLQEAYLVRCEDLGGGRDKVYDIMHERLLAPARAILQESPDVAWFREAAANIAHKDAPRQGIKLEDCRQLLTPDRAVVWDVRTAAILLDNLLRRGTPRDLREILGTRVAAGVPVEAAIGADRMPQAGVASAVPMAESEILQVRSALGRLASRVAGDLLDGDSLQDACLEDGCLGVDEVRAVLDLPPARERDLAALAGALQAPAGALRPEIRVLAERLRGLA